jgi:hypothetical protein
LEQSVFQTQALGLGTELVAYCKILYDKISLKVDWKEWKVSNQMSRIELPVRATSPVKIGWSDIS